MRTLFVLLTTVALGVAATLNPAHAEVLKVAGPWEITGIDPAQTGYVFSRLQVAETLVTANHNGKIVPALADRWSVSGDGLTWRFTLRENARFHDGTPVTAETAAASLTRALAGVGVLSQAPLAEITSEGRDVVIRLTKPFSALPAYLVHFSTIVLAPSSYDAAGKVTQIVGSGPYKVKSLTAPARLELQASGGWWGGKPAIEEVSYLAVGQGETRALMAESGEADLVFSMLPVSVDRLKANLKLDVQIATIPRTRVLKVNAASPFFDQVEERQAISAAIDRVGITKVILRNADLAATQLFPPAMKGWNSRDIPPLVRDVDRAKELLAAAGWKAGSDGVLQKDGKRFSVTLLTYSSWPELPPIATALQAQLRQVGIEVKVSVGNSSEIPARHQDGTLEMGLISRLYSIVPDPVGTLLQDYGAGGSDWGSMGWDNKEIQSVVEQLAATSDAAARAPLQSRALEILQQELPSIPITWSELAIVSNKRITGVTVDPLEVNYGLSAIRWAE
ncbi:MULTISPECIES: ABC transporter substrate-binding protein [Sinorhizobium]|uniref:ABC transporter substrate-binding protein n=2 Tax=Sinorhizobium TaxID=28105 RepID=A0A2S3YUP0_9HYPH|nr:MULTISPECIES: ABC transporter substrate-binding protein [Sinorhizobium]AUX77607.1 dipeptide/oligopeptide ABC transporter substrate-binding protein [Sinorhizobium fredii]PDT39421.1 ABC transporter substrate-binding protein [Sinorhizobium sp. FG01]POH35348.1 ABC transporter substrate-binding protein [Sinorhizobium americanum]